MIAKEDAKPNEDLKELEESVQKLWDYETVRIRNEKNVQDALKERISFNGTRCEMRKAECENGPLEAENEELTFVKETIGPTEVAGKEKVLGMLWDCDSDEFIYSFSKIVERMRELIPTKRNILSILASLYDPWGVISPIVVSLKVLFQELCVDKVPWDKELTGEMCKK